MIRHCVKVKWIQSPNNEVPTHEHEHDQYDRMSDFQAHIHEMKLVFCDLKVVFNVMNPKEIKWNDENCGLW